MASSNFAGGNMGIASPRVNNSSQSVPYTDNSTGLGDAFTLAANAQTDGSGYNRVWNNYAPNNKSSWQKQNQRGTISSKGYTQTISFTTNASDAGATYTANLARAFRISRYDQTEFDGTILENNVTQIVEGNSGTVPTPSAQAINGKNYVFAGWKHGSSGSVTPTNNMVYPDTALYKVVHLSNDASAFSSNGQRKFLKTANSSNGWYHMVYTSMGHVWLEHSPQGGTTWVLGNNGRPLDDGGGSSPSIDQEGTSANGYEIVVAFQEGNNIRVRSCYDNGSGLYVNGPNQIIPNVSSCSGIAWNSNGIFMVIFKQSSGIYYVIGYLGYVNSAPCIDYYPASIGKIPDTDANSRNPTISTIQRSDGVARFDVAWEELRPPQSGPPTVEIWASELYFDGRYNPPFSGQVGVIYPLPPSAPHVVVSSSAMKLNSHPSIIGLPDGARVCWIADYSGIGDVTQTRTQLCNPFTPTISYVSYSPFCQSTSINKRNDNSVFYFVFSQVIPPPYDPTPVTTDYAVGSKNLSFTPALNTHSSDLQLCNGSDSSNILAMSYNTSTSPYSFQSSCSMASGGLAKSSPISTENSRGVVVENEGAGIYYSFGNITVDGRPVDFMQMKDNPGQIKSDSPGKNKDKETLDSNAIDRVNTVLLSEPFEMRDNSKIHFSDYAVIGDSSAAVALLGDSAYVSFKVALVDPATGKLIGIIKKVTFDHNGLQPHNLSYYKLVSSGNEGRTVRLRITLTTNISSPELSVLDVYTNSGVSALNNRAAQSLTLQDEEVVTDYVLGQNYPNPFNPTTSISYAIPGDGLVTLKVYDVIGREVETLVNQVQKVGKYEVSFDASRLASGVYFYRLVSGTHVITKKMLLVK